MNKKWRRCIVSFFTIIIVSIVVTNTAFSHSGGVGDNLYNGRTWQFNCLSGNDTCPRWIRVDIDTFKDIYTSSANDLGDFAPSAYATCIDTTQNKDGYVVFTGLTNFSGSRPYINYNSKKLTLTNPHHNPGVYAPSSNLKNLPNKNYHIHDMESGSSGGTTKDMRTFYTDIDSSLSYYDIYQAVLSDSGLTEDYNDDTSSQSPYRLAFFCYGMTSSPVRRDETDVYRVQENASIGGSDYKGRKYTVSLGTNTVYVNFSPTVFLNGLSTTTGYEFTSYGNEITVDGRMQIRDASGTARVDIPEDDESKHEACGYARIKPSTRTSTYEGSNPTPISESTDGEEADSACVELRRDYVPAEPTYSYPTATATFYSTKPDVSPSGDPYSVAKDVTSVEINFSNARTITGPTKNDPNDYFGKASVTPSYNPSDFIVIGNDTQTISTPDNGEVKNRAACQSITDSVTYTYTFKVTQQRVKNVESGAYENVGDPTYELESKSGGYQSGTKETCLDIYREAESLIETKTDINLTGDYTSDGINSSTVKSASSDGEFSPNPIHIGYDPTENPSDSKIFAQSDENDKININYTYYLKRKGHPNNYDAKYALDYPWYAYSMLNDSGSINLNSPNYWKNVYSTNSTKEVANNSGELNLGDYNITYCNSVSSNNRAYKIEYNKVINEDPSSEYAGKPESTACAHLYRPWNYKLSFDKVEALGAPVAKLVDEGTAQIEVTIKNSKNDSPEQEGNPSYSPDITVTLYKIKVLSKSDLTNYNVDINNCNDDNTVDSPLYNCLSGGEEISRENYGNLKYDTGTKNHTFKDDNYNDGDKYDVGDHVCYYAKINYSNSVKDTNGNHGYGNLTNYPLFSHLTCFTVAGVPHAEVWGGSVYSEGDINTKIYEQSGTLLSGGTTGSHYVIGSWSDYGVVGKSNIKGFASGKTIFGRFETDEYDCQNHPLTINNENCKNPADDHIGNNSIITTKTKIKFLKRYEKKDLSSTGSTLHRGGNGQDYDYICFENYTYQNTKVCDGTRNDLFRYSKSTSDINSLGELELDYGATHVIYAQGNITIDKNITYEMPPGGYYKTVDQIPQYIIIADGDININENVTEINAWLIAGGKINTCDRSPYDNNEKYLPDPDTSHNKDVCTNQLEINGPIFANNLELDRTHYRMADTAEKMDLSAFSYYWAYSQSKRTGTINTVYLRSLPPRH